MNPAILGPKAVAVITLILTVWAVLTGEGDQDDD